MATLNTFPDPPPVGYTTVCETETQLVACLSVDPAIRKLTEKISHYPKIVVQKDVRVLASKDSSKSAFLPHRDTLWTRIMVAWCERGIFGFLTELSSNRAAPSVLSWMARILLSAFRWVYALQGSLYSHLGLSGEEMIARFSPALDWQEGLVRALAWHPHTTKFALCTWDDSIKIYTVGMETTPLLRHRMQKGVADLAWRPFSASDLAVACQNGILIWRVDPTSLVSRPSGSCVQVLSQSGHGPVTSIDWKPDGSRLISGSAADTAMVVWDPPMETKTSMRRIGGAGVSLVRWSPDCHKVFAATPSTLFRVWEAVRWNFEVWNTPTFVRAACWSPDSSLVLFAKESDPVVYSLGFDNKSAGDIGGSQAALSVLDLAETEFEVSTGRTKAGGEIRDMQWDPKGERLAVSFVRKEKTSQTHHLIAIYRTRIKPVLEIVPCGFVRGNLGEYPQCMAFQKNFEGGALLTVAWNNGRISHIPFYFIPLGADQDQLAQTSLLTRVRNNQQLFS